MNFELSENQRKLVDNFRQFGERVFKPEDVKRWCAGQGLPDEVVHEFAEVYFSSQDLGANESGDYDLVSRALILEELSRCAGATLPFQHDFFNLKITESFSSDETFRDTLEGYRDHGRLMFAVAISEDGAGSDIMGIKTSVRTIDGKILLNGTKSYVCNGEYSPYALVAAIDENDDTPSRHPHLAFWLVPRGLPGVRAYPIEKVAQTMVPFAIMEFENVELKPEWRLDSKSTSFPKLFNLLESGRVFICASSVGLAQAAMEDAVHAAASRERFGRRIADFQQIGEKLTDMEARIQAMRSLLYRAAWEVDTQAPNHRLTIALMKRFIPATATSVASDALQILGGVGYTEQARTARIWRDCRGNQIAEGTDEIMVHIAAPLILKKYLGENA